MEQKILEIFDGQNGFSAMADMSPSIFALYILHHKRLQAVSHEVKSNGDDIRTGKLGKRKASAGEEDSEQQQYTLLQHPGKKVLKNGTMQSSPQEIVDMSTHPEIDESLYSRQLYVLGHEAMKRMSSSNVLIVGLKGLGAEIAKNVALAGVKSLSLHDPTPVTISDLSSQFFLSPEDIGRSRAEATAPRVAELNAYTPVTIHGSQSLTDDLPQLNKYQVVVLTATPLRDQLVIAEYCHKNKIFVIIADTFGLFGYIFTDFGENFTVVDATGEEPTSGIVAGIDEEGLVSASDEARHGLGEDDYVIFTEVKGMEKLNNSEPRKVDIKGPYTFSIGDVSGLGTYESGGIFTQVKMPKTLNFKSFKQQLENPEILITDFMKMDRPAKVHLGIQALHKFAEIHGGKFPRPHNESDAQEVIELASRIGGEVDKDILRELSYQAQGDLSPMAAFFGGLAAQEVLKAVSGKFHPVVQWYYFDSLESLPSSVTRSEAECAPLGTRYDGQIAVFGKSFQKKISEVKEFLVGSGAIGCEMLKNWAMIGLATGENGKITVTDMDQIETSNLNRQFLFRPKDVGQLKSDTAAKAVQAMNPDLQGKIVSLRERVGADTEHIFSEDFWEELDGVTNALDNIEARTYIDRRCVFFQKPLLESGTLGTKGNTQVILPWLTESYSSSQDPPEQSFPMCTLRSFPNRIEHTIAWARELFQTSFVGPPESVNLYLTQPDYTKTTLKQSGNEKQTLEILRDFLVTDKPLSFDDCIVWARHQFEANFNNAIQQLLYNFPRDSVTSSGTPFWSGPKRAPTPLKFDPTNPTHFSFIVAAANLHAYNYGIKNPGADKGHYRKVLDDMIVPEFTPSSGVKIQANDNEPDPNAKPGFTDEEELKRLIAALPSPKSLAGFQLEPVVFEKDDDTNHHIDFITAASNLRAANYDIQQADRHKTKFIAGKIIPAIATTTALVTGLVILELYKIIDGKPHLEQYKNSFVNLALPFFSFIDPIASPMDKYHHKGREIWFHKLWDRFEADDMVLQDFLKSCEEQNGLDISMISSGVSLLYPVFNKGPDVMRKRLQMKLSELVQSVSDKAIPDHQKYVIFEFLARDDTDEDVDVPYVSVKVDKPAKKDAKG
ncbi:ubiquitin-activating enzyme E1 [Histoplasma capsulatum var. duboisii H88]|uniref:Ubiquitin-activating enzyme E1 1 n=2 Tax=Ajellomyces capsulatus (strain H88) TaxID=544711 RepID=F0UNE4_AJEC8|nr:ubiquitin-activating enzyme E1 [Histoplasma capsulatum var. duboisii H88]